MAGKSQPWDDGTLNAERCARIDRIIADEYEYEDPRASVIDILADVMHFCASSVDGPVEINFENALRVARGHFECEKGGDA